MKQVCLLILPCSATHNSISCILEKEERMTIDECDENIYP